MLERQSSKHKTPTCGEAGSSLFMPTVLLETDVLSALRVSDEMSTLPSDLYGQ